MALMSVLGTAVMGNMEAFQYHSEESQVYTRIVFYNSHLPMKLLNYFLFVGLGWQEFFLLKF